jgi:hypothetical protein
VGGMEQEASWPEPLAVVSNRELLSLFGGDSELFGGRDFNLGGLVFGGPGCGDAQRSNGSNGHVGSFGGYDSEFQTGLGTIAD